ncbi:SURF1 family protein [Rhodobacter sp. Har01]|uniref:SURF1 family protein n=1 Tax=Rhodobacter sp. Har01 TaxID=2883999 RepID=UPI001D0647F7|nr:SURF1 family protein [Rhodobacter sp. Har01]MCB6178790.1 SURF1 family protein [Rhodobacter sp. Har01]
MRQVLFFLIVGVLGVSVLLALGFWQLRRLDWKEAIIAEASAMMQAAPVALPASPDPKADNYRPVQVAGRFTGQEAHVLASTLSMGPGFRVIAAFETAEGRRILVDRGYVPETARTTDRPGHPAEVTGNLVWPDDMTASTPPYDAARAIWFSRDLPGISAALKTEPVQLVARSDTGDGITPQPATAAFRNDHLQYALTWFGLAAVWSLMTLAFLWRIRRPKA